MASPAPKCEVLPAADAIRHVPLYWAPATSHLQMPPSPYSKRQHVRSLGNETFQRKHLYLLASLVQDGHGFLQHRRHFCAAEKRHILRLASLFLQNSLNVAALAGPPRSRYPSHCPCPQFSKLFTGLILRLRERSTGHMTLYGMAGGSSSQ